MARIAPYAEQHKDPQGPGDARPTASQVIEDQGLNEGDPWAGKVVLVTGVSPGGLGIETAKVLHLTGANVFITARDPKKGKEAAVEIAKDGKPGRIEVIEMDLASLKSVRAGAEDFLRKSGHRLNVLINNAGVMFCPYSKTEDGFEMHMAANHFGHFLLFTLVKDALLQSASPSFNSRVVSLSSGAHRNGVINLDDLNFDKTEYDVRVAYRQSKLANVYFANELDRRYKSQNLRAFSVHPGGILTNLVRHMDLSAVQATSGPGIAQTMKSAEQGAATSVWAAVAKELDGRGGIYLDEVAEAELAPPGTAYYLGGYGPQAFDPPMETKLWDESLRLTGSVAD